MGRWGVTKDSNWEVRFRGLHRGLGLRGIDLYDLLGADLRALWKVTPEMATEMGQERLMGQVADQLRPLFESVSEYGDVTREQFDLSLDVSYNMPNVTGFENREVIKRQKRLSEQGGVSFSKSREYVTYFCNTVVPEVKRQLIAAGIITEDADPPTVEIPLSAPVPETLARAETELSAAMSVHGGPEPLSQGSSALLPRKASTHFVTPPPFREPLILKPRTVPPFNLGEGVNGDRKLEGSSLTEVASIPASPTPSVVARTDVVLALQPVEDEDYDRNLAEDLPEDDPPPEEGKASWSGRSIAAAVLGPILVPFVFLAAVATHGTFWTFFSPDRPTYKTDLVYVDQHGLQTYTDILYDGSLSPKGPLLAGVQVYIFCEDRVVTDGNAEYWYGVQSQEVMKPPIPDKMVYARSSELEQSTVAVSGRGYPPSENQSWPACNDLPIEQHPAYVVMSGVTLAGVLGLVLTFWLIEVLGDAARTVGARIRSWRQQEQS